MILLLDCNALCHRARYAMKGKELTTDRMRTEVIFNFMHQLLRFSQEFKGSKFVFAWDSKARARRKVWSEYKVKDKEEKSPDDVRFDEVTFPQFNEIRRNILPAMGFMNIFIQTGREADDIIASIVLSNIEKEIVILSRDGDLHQLLFNDNIKQYDYQTQNFTTRKSFIKKWGISPDAWAEVKAIAGCKSDEIDGVEKVAEKTAIKYLNGYLKETTAAYFNIKNSDGLIHRNRKLVSLPFPGTYEFKLKKDEVTSLKLLRVFEELDFQYFLRPEEFEKWEEGFSL